MKTNFFASTLRSEDGFTLVELMFAILVVGMTLLAYMGGNVAISQTAEQSHEKMVAFNDAMRLVELMRATAQSGSFPSNVVTAYPNNTATLSLTNLTSETITQSYVSTTADPLDVTVTVSWSSRGIRTLTKSIRTLITQRA